MSTSTRERLLDATFMRVAEDGLSRLALEDVAAAAGVSRQTLYRHFGSRDGLLQALVLREEQWFIDRVRAAAAGHDNADDAIAAGFSAALQAAGEHPLLRHLLQTEPGEILPLVVLGRGPVISAARPVIAEILTEHLDLPVGEVDVLTDVLGRLLISYVLDAGSPGPYRPDDMGHRVAHIVLHGADSNRERSA